MGDSQLLAFLLHALLFLFYWIVTGSLALYFGEVAIGKLLARRPDSLLEAWCHGFVVLALVGYGVFWIYLLDERLGYAATAASFGVAVFQLTRRRTTTRMLRDGSLRLLAGCGVFYLAILHLYSAESASLPVAQRFLDMPADNLLQLSLGNLLRLGEPLQPFYGKWTVSDRPPLQAGLYLMFSWDGLAVYYQSLALLLQLAWLPSLRYLAGTLGCGRRSIDVVTCLCIFSGFFLFNSLYTWPKLLAAALGMICLASLVRGARETSRWAPAFSGAAFGAALLSHGGSLVSLPLVLATLFGTRSAAAASTPRRVACFAAPALALLLSWSAFQVWIDPPGNHVSKWHLAGVHDLSDTRSLPEALRDAYSELSFAEIAQVRVSNLGLLIGSGGLRFFPRRPTIEFHYLVPALGFAALGAFFLVYARARGRASPLAMSGLLSLGLIASYAGWVLLLFERGAVNHHNSYLVIALTFLLLGAGVALAPGYAVVAIVAAQIVRFFTVWVFRSDAAAYGLRLETSLCVATLLGAAALVWLVTSAGRDPDVTRRGIP